MKDTDEIFEEMAAGVEEKTGVKLSRGGDMALRLYAVAAELSSLWIQTEWLKTQCFPQTATGENLEHHAAMRGLERGRALCAQGSITFETDAARDSDLSVAAGTVCMNAAGTEFLTTAAGVIAAGETSCTVTAKARLGGSFGNAPADSICYMALAPVGIIKCSNPQAFSGGTDEESDDELRKRVLASFAALPNGSNTAFYEQEALGFDGVAAAVVTPKNRGVGTVDIIIAGDDGFPSNQLISALEAKLNSEREICVDVDVAAPETVTVNVTAAIDVASGYDTDVVVQNVKNAVEELFDGKMLGKSVLLAKLGSVIYSVNGVENYSISAPTADVAVESGELPVLGSVSITRRTP